MHELDDVTGLIVDAAMRIHQELGPGLLESVYELVLERTLAARGLRRIVNQLPPSASPRLRVNRPLEESYELPAAIFFWATTRIE